MMNGCATPEGTAAYAQRFSALDGNYRPLLGLAVSSIGLGTYLGQSDAATDAAYAEALRAALTSGINVIDTAVNYRDQRSERVIGAVMAELCAAGKLRREEIVVATKGGYLAFDGGMPADPRAWFEAQFIKPGIVRAGDVVDGSHCMTPRYLDAMIETSRRNLGLATIDIYYLHNPEAQLSALSREQFNARLRDAFRALEGAVRDGRIGVYGAATWNGYRATPKDRGYLSLTDMAAIAREVGGEGHHFRVVQLPYNLAMTEALTARNQPMPDGKNGSLLAASDILGIGVCASASLLQGQLTRGLPAILEETFTGLNSDAQRALQFVRSTPGVNVALAGMSTVAHVAHNLGVAQHPPASFETLLKLFEPTK
ncbi:MAG TPA: aldo/keto reductase [Candidatus Binataceae bacterium]|nr:aldo/keto reductase [Candidatus Binataceae bacterium]